jgi:hypothetical protein
VEGISWRGILDKKIADMPIIATPLMRGKTLGSELDLMRKFQPTCRVAEIRTSMIPVRDMNSIKRLFS